MAGKKCPECGRATFFKTPKGRACSICGFKMTVPPNGGKSGKGSRCSNCGSNAVFNGVCSKCGAKYGK